MDKNPRVSVLMPVYNGECYFREAIESILNQTYIDFEFIIIDDGSTDNTWQILQSYAANEPRIVLVRNETNVGLAGSLSKGLGLARGKYIARMDVDDVVQTVSVIHSLYDAFMAKRYLSMLEKRAIRRNAAHRLIGLGLMLKKILPDMGQFIVVLTRK